MFSSLTGVKTVVLYVTTFKNFFAQVQLNNSTLKTIYHSRYTSTSPDPVNNSMLLELKRDIRKGVGKGIQAGAR